MVIDGLVDFFVLFYNVNCFCGFLYFNRQGELRISVLFVYLFYDVLWFVRKILLCCMVYYVVYYVEFKVYVVVISINMLCVCILCMIGEEKEFEIIERDEWYIYFQQEVFFIQFIFLVSWEVIFNVRIELQEWEYVICMKIVFLCSEEIVLGFKGYVVVGICFMQGEEVMC